MRIKKPSRKHLEKSRLRQLSTHYWLIPPDPKPSGRLGQLSKHNRRNRKPSEFVVMAKAIEERYEIR